MFAQPEADRPPHWLEKYWLLIPVGLIIVMFVAILETTWLNLSIAPNLELGRVVDIPLAGGPTRFDYQSLDPQTGLLFIAHSGADMLTVFDTRAKRIIANISNIAHVHGVLAVAQLGRVYATDSDDNLVYVIDERTMHTVAKIQVGDGPDGLTYDPSTHRVFVSDEAGQNDAVIDTQTEKLVTMISLGGEAGNTQYDPGSHHIFVAVQTLNQLVTIDPVTLHVINRSPLPGCDHDHGLNIDAPQRLAFVACDGNATLLMVDLQTMQVISSQSVGKNPDVLALDMGWHYLYIASESGVVTVFDEHGRTLRKVAEGFIAFDAHSVAVDQETHNLYLPLENVNNQPFLRIGLFHSPN
ncbi:MAG: YncE family protein [Ktedonobacteraceae bacterium]